MEFMQKSKKDDWQTPPEIIKPLNDLVGIDLDPCAGVNTTHGDTNIKPPSNGLNIDWFGVVFVNPPFSEKTKWIKKCVKEIEKGNAKTVFLLTPDSTDVKSWWHTYIAKHAKCTLFFRGRINYINPKTNKQANGVSFGSALSVFGEVPKDFIGWAISNGDFMIRPQ